MKKILVFLSMSLMLANASWISKLWAEDYPVYNGTLVNITYRVVEQGQVSAIVEIDGKKYTIILKS
jgi:hypothetical protein